MKSQQKRPQCVHMTSKTYSIIRLMSYHNLQQKIFLFPQKPCRSRSLIPSLAPSWWWPCPLLRWALLTLSGYVLSLFFASVSLVDPVALSPLLRRVYADGSRHWCAFRSCGGASPHAFGSVRALGELRWLHLYRLTPDLVGLRQFAV